MSRTLNLTAHLLRGAVDLPSFPGDWLRPRLRRCLWRCLCLDGSTVARGPGEASVHWALIDLSTGFSLAGDWSSAGSALWSGVRSSAPRS